MKKRVKKPRVGAPGWVVTFADLMSLLLTFFILILSFADVNEPKFKRAMGSVQWALGVKKEYLYENPLSSNNPLKDNFRMGAMQDDNQYSQTQILSANANEFCELESEKEAKNSQYMEQLLNIVISKLSVRPLVQEFFDIKMEDREIEVKFSQAKMFKSNSASMENQAIAALRSLFEGLPEEALDINITHHSSLSGPEKEASTLWENSSKRLFNLARQVNNIPSTRKHKVSVSSVPQRKPATGSSDDRIGIYIKHMSGKDR